MAEPLVFDAAPGASLGQLRRAAQGYPGGGRTIGRFQLKDGAGVAPRPTSPARGMALLRNPLGAGDRRTGPGQPVDSALRYRLYGVWPKDGKAGAAPVAYRRIDEAVHVVGKGGPRERIPRGITEGRIRIERRMPPRFPEIVMFAGEAREKFGVIDH